MTIDDEETVISVLAQLGITPAKISYPSGREVVCLNQNTKRRYICRSRQYKNNNLAYFPLPNNSA